MGNRLTQFDDDELLAELSDRLEKARSEAEMAEERGYESGQEQAYDEAREYVLGPMESWARGIERQHLLDHPDPWRWCTDPGCVAVREFDKNADRI